MMKSTTIQSISSMNVAVNRVKMHCPLHGTQVALTIDGSRPACPECEENQRQAQLKQEAQAQQHTRIKALKTKSGIPLRYFETNLKTLSAKNESQNSVIEGVKGYFEKLKENPSLNLGILGSVGTGKTHIACALINSYLLANGCNCLYTTASDLFRRIKASWGKDTQESEYQAMKHFTTPQLLVIDEIGAQFGTDVEKQLLFEVINARYNHLKATVLLSNLGFQAFNDLLGERIIDRLRENGGKILVLTGKSVRN